MVHVKRLPLFNAINFFRSISGMEFWPPTIASLIITRMVLMAFFWDPTKSEAITFSGLLTALLLALTVVVVANAISILFIRMVIKIKEKRVAEYKKAEVKDDWETHVMIFWMLAAVASMMMPFAIVGLKA